MNQINFLFLLVCLTTLTLGISAQETKSELPPRGNQISEQVKYPELSDELLRRMKADQDMRKEMASKYPPGQPIPADALEKFRNVDKENTEWLKKTIDKYGYLGYTAVGRQAEIAAFLLIQHPDQDSAFQKKLLELIRQAAAQKDASPTSLAYLTDRVQVAEGKPQIYGTQMRMNNGRLEPTPIEDEENVDKRRAEIGLPSMADYIKMIQSRAPKPSN